MTRCRECGQPSRDRHGRQTGAFLFWRADVERLAAERAAS